MKAFDLALSGIIRKLFFHSCQKRRIADMNLTFFRHPQKGAYSKNPFDACQAAAE